jgi:tetratricopeptide (TPR) repeat protein
MDYRQEILELDTIERKDEATFRCKEFIRQARDSGDYHYKFFFEGQLNIINGVYDDGLNKLRKALELEPGNTLFLVSAGICCAHMKRLHEAVAYYDQALNIDENNLKAIVHKAYLLSTIGELRRAINVYDHVLKLEPENLQALQYRGMALQKTGHVEKALEDLDKVLAGQPQNPLALMYKGFALMDLGREHESLLLLQEALRLEPHNPELLAQLGLMYLRRGIYDEALNHLDKALALDPRNATLLCSKGKALSRLGYHREAITFFDVTLRVEPDNKEAWRGKGESLTALGAREEGLSCFEEAIKLDSNHLESLISKITSLNYMGNYREALDEAERALAIDRDNLAIFIEKGLSYHGLGMHQQALDLFETILNRNPRSVKALFHKGLSLEKMNRHLEAMEAFQAVRREVPQDSTALLHLATNLSRLDRPQEALEICDESLLISPNNHEILSLKGSALLELGFQKEALLYFNKAIELNDTHPASILGKGKTLAAQGLWKDALEFYQDHLQKDPGNHLLLAELGTASAHLGDFREAVHYYDRSLELQPRNVDLMALKVIALEKIEDFEEAARVLYRVLKNLNRTDPRRAFFEFKYDYLSKFKREDTSRTIKAEEAHQEAHQRFINSILNDFWKDEIETYDEMVKLQSRQQAFLSERGRILLTREEPDPFIHFTSGTRDLPGAGGTIIVTGDVGMAINPGEGFIEHLIESPFHLADLDVLVLTRQSASTTFMVERLLNLLSKSRSFTEKRARQEHFLEIQKKIQALAREKDLPFEEIQRLLESGYRLREDLAYKKFSLIVSPGIYRLISPIAAEYRDYIGQLMILDASSHPVPLQYNAKITFTALPGAADNSEDPGMSLIVSLPERHIVYTDSVPAAEKETIRKVCRENVLLLVSVRALYEGELDRSAGLIEGLYGKKRGLAALSWCSELFNPHLIVLNDVGSRYAGLQDRLTSMISSALKRPCMSACPGLEISLHTYGPRCSSCRKYLTLDMVRHSLAVPESATHLKKIYRCKDCSGPGAVF